MERWRGKVAIVTGASSGIGAVVAELLVGSGLQVVGLARRKEKIEELSQKLLNQPGKLYAIKTDVTKEDEINEAFNWVKEKFGSIHILINNAGLLIPGSFINSNPETWKHLLNTNLTSVCTMTQLAIKNMKENNVDGHIIQVNSILGHIIPYGVSLNIYPVSKYGLTAFTEVIRHELVEIGSKIKVSMISPGVVDTDIFAINDITTYVTAPKLQPKDVADAIMYMLATPPHVQIHDIIIKPVGEMA